MAQDATIKLELIKQAFRNDDASTVARILEQNPELKRRINEPVGSFHSPVITSAKSPEMLDVLLTAGADIDAKSDWWAGGFGLLHTADPELAAYAITRGATVDAHAAARLGLIDTLRSLVSADPALVHARGGDGQTPLHFAANVEIAEYLLGQGAEIDALDVDHESTPAQWMVSSRSDVARYLVSRGCKTDLLMATALGDVPLVRSILDRDLESIRMRVSDEWFPMINPKTGGTIYQWELGWYVSAHQIARRLGHEELFDLLMDRSPAGVKLLTACWLGDEPMADRLLSNAIPAPDPAAIAQNERQLAHAARNNDLPAVRLMLKAGLPITSRSQHGATALHWACWHGNIDMAKALLPFDPPLDDQENDYQGTPLGWAIYASSNGWNPAGGDYPGIVELLISAGAKLPEKQSGVDAVKQVLARHGVQA